ncbi:type II toxin-antitoxin system VapC family toxin [Desulfococcaceae bacterium HSG8]|nr:type II toxin-antitoxin system VapC family toxin [Desulfococcaceae bacterium HSG8]
MKSSYMFDTHALIFWNLKKGVSNEFIEFFDEQSDKGNVLVSAISFWEMALLSKKGRIEIADVELWKSDLTKNTGIGIVTPEASEMIASVYLPEIHKDPFDRLLIVQANRHNAMLVTKDELIKAYSVEVFWV